MSLALIHESAKEVRRLAIAGSPLAVGDFRLKKLIAPLEQAGAKVPVFAQVAKAMSELVNGTEADSAARLLGLSTLLNAILYTQGQTGADGDCREVEIFLTGCSSTTTTARVLKPLMEALTSAGGGRLEVVEAAVERGLFNDLRLIGPAIRALDDNFPELADLVAKKILPSYGRGIAPLLKQGLDVKGKRRDARRLGVLHDLDPAGTVELCKHALDEGSAEVKVSAIGCLGEHEECIPLLFERANSKNKTVRAAALEALAAHDRPEVAKLFTDLIKGKTLDLLARPLRAMRNPQVFDSLLAEGKRVFDLLLTGDEEQVSRYWEVLTCLDERTEAEVEGFLLGCFEQCEKISKLKAPKKSIVSNDDVINRLASLLYAIGSPKALEAMLAKRGVLPFASFNLVLRSALRAWPAEKVYQEFGPLLGKKKGVDNEIQRIIWASRHESIPEFLRINAIEVDILGDEALKKVEWDPRWLDAAIKADHPVIACYLARPGHRGAVDYLLKQFGAKNQPTPGFVIQALAHCQYPNLTDVFLDVVAKKVKSAPFYDYVLQLLFQCVRCLPSSDLPRLEAFAAKLDEKYVDKFLEALETLRPAKQPENS